MIGTFSLFIVLRTNISVFGLGEEVVVVVKVAVVVVKVVVVITGQVYSGHGHPSGQPDRHGHRSKFSFEKFDFKFSVYQLRQNSIIEVSEENCGTLSKE